MCRGGGPIWQLATRTEHGYPTKMHVTRVSVASEHYFILLLLSMIAIVCRQQSTNSYYAIVGAICTDSSSLRDPVR